MLALLAMLATAAPPDSARLPRVLVLPLESKAGVPADVAELITSAMVTEAGKLPGYRVMSFKEVQGAMTAEQLKQISGCTAASCAVEIAGSLDVDELLMGSLGQLGKQYILNVSRLRARDGLAVGRSMLRVSVEDPTAVLDDMPRVVAELFPRQGLPVATRPPASPPEEPAPRPTAVAPTPVPEAATPGPVAVVPPPAPTPPRESAPSPSAKRDTDDDDDDIDDDTPRKSLRKSRQPTRRVVPGWATPVLSTGIVSCIAAIPCYAAGLVAALVGIAVLSGSASPAFSGDSALAYVGCCGMVGGGVVGAVGYVAALLSLYCLPCFGIVSIIAGILGHAALAKNVPISADEG